MATLLLQRLIIHSERETQVDQPEHIPKVAGRCIVRHYPRLRQRLKTVIGLNEGALISVDLFGRDWYIFITSFVANFLGFRKNFRWISGILLAVYPALVPNEMRRRSQVNLML